MVQLFVTNFPQKSLLITKKSLRLCVILTVRAFGSWGGAAVWSFLAMCAFDPRAGRRSLGRGDRLPAVLSGGLYIKRREFGMEALATERK